MRPEDGGGLKKIFQLHIQGASQDPESLRSSPGDSVTLGATPVEGDDMPTARPGASFHLHCSQMRAGRVGDANRETSLAAPEVASGSGVIASYLKSPLCSEAWAEGSCPGSQSTAATL